ncbi:MAG: acetate--CoA ligase [Acidimicrobiia bacterium]|nr:acetate--CoA ligase [Acidimicrobiia bacterium]
MAELSVTPNLTDYDAARSSFDWEEGVVALDGLPDGGGLNMAYEAVDRHVVGGHGKKVALRWLGRRGEQRDISYEELATLTDRFAMVLRSLGIGPGDRVFTLAGRIPELYVAVLGTLKNRSVAAPLFSAFGPEPIQTRINLGEGTVLVTTEALYRKKVAAIRESLPTLSAVILVGLGGATTDVPGTLDFGTLMRAVSDEFEIEPTDPEELALLHFTSGTTGTPKGAMHVHAAVRWHYLSGRYALDLHPDDVFWCTADPGWVTGTSYGIVSPLTHGVTVVVDEAEFDAERWYRIIEEHAVTVWYTAPTAVRMMMRLGSEVPKEFDLSSLRFIASVGEPLNPEGVVWGLAAFGLPIHDNWWQTETGGIMIANYAATTIHPGSMGRPLPGIEATIVRRTDKGAVLVEKGAAVEAECGEEGELALRPGWPAMFRGYLNMEERYQEAFAGGWYLSGDLAEKDADGYFWFVGRADDVIKSSGHLIGPFEVESTLIEHEAVAEVGVIGKPDEMAGEIVKAFVALNPGVAATPQLEKELFALARKKLGPAVAPREIEFKDRLPKTRSGKIMRRLLKAWELDLPAGDISTLEDES